MNNDNNNGIVFDSNNTNNILVTPTNDIKNNVPTAQVNNIENNTTVDYNSLYNVNNNIETVENNTQIEEINKKIEAEQIVTPESTAIENVKTDDGRDSKKGIAFVFIIAVLILASIFFLFPILVKKGF